MKKLKPTLVLIAILLTTLSALNQTIKLSDGKSEKLLDPNTFFTATISESVKADEKKCCDYQQLTGYITSINNDSISFKVKSLNVKKHTSDQEFNYNYFFSVSPREMTFAQKDIYYINKSKSEKSKNKHRNLFGIGGIIIFTGAATALNNFFVKEESDKKTLLISGGIQIGLGIILMSVGGEKNYYLNHKLRNWHFDDF